MTGNHPTATTATDDLGVLASASPTADKPGSSAHRPARRWLSLVAAMAAFLGIGLLAPAPASAATQYATVSVCFTVPGGYVYPGGPHTGSVSYHVRGAPSWTPVQWQSFAGSANGCSRWSVVVGVQFRFQAWSSSAGVVTCGSTQWYTGLRAGSSYHLGTFNAYRAVSNAQCL